jgi:hypothetical protein
MDQVQLRWMDSSMELQELLVYAQICHKVVFHTGRQILVPKYANTLKVAIHLGIVLKDCQRSFKSIFISPIMYKLYDLMVHVHI